MKEIQEVAEEFGRELLIDPGAPAPAAPVHAEPQPGQPRTPEIAAEDKPVERLEMCSSRIFQGESFEKDTGA